MKIKQVALIRFVESPGFVGEPITWVRRVRFFDSKKKARLYNRIIWQRTGSLNIYGEPILPFDMLTQGKKVWWSDEDLFQKYAIERQIQEPPIETIMQYLI